MMDASRLFEIAESFKLSRALQAAACRGLLDLLIAGPRTEAEIASRLSWEGPTLGAVLAVLVPARIVMREGDCFSIPSEVRPHFTAGGPTSVLHAIKWMAFQYKQYERLIPGGESDQAEFTNTWMACLHELGQKERYAASVAEVLPLEEAATVLDLGGGSGIYAIAMCAAFPRLKATVFDRPHVTPYTERYVSASPFASRIRVVSGDFSTGDLPQGMDAVFVSNVFHGRDPSVLNALCDKILACLVPGGWLFVHGQHIDGNSKHSLAAGLLNLTMAVNGGGRCYSVQETRELLVRAGFVHFSERHPRQHPTADIILARKPPSVGA